MKNIIILPFLIDYLEKILLFCVFTSFTHDYVKIINVKDVVVCLKY